jgi:3-mercaptopyruvate sulfurtransferase SseA
MNRRRALSVMLLGAGLSGCRRASQAAAAAAEREPERLSVADSLARRDRGEAVIVDVRSPQAYAEGHVRGAINVPGAEVSSRSEELRSLHKLPILYCG